MTLVSMGRRASDGATVGEGIDTWRMRRQPMGAPWLSGSGKYAASRNVDGGGEVLSPLVVPLCNASWMARMDVEGSEDQIARRVKTKRVVRAGSA